MAARENGTDSYFDGGLLGLIGTNIVVFLIIVFTLTIGLPWAIVRKQKWMTSHTVIEGRRLEFIGTGMGLIGNYIKWMLLTLITLGIYGFWLNIKLQQWVVKNTIFCGTN